MLKSQLELRRLTTRPSPDSRIAVQDDTTYISRRHAAMGALVGAASLLQSSQASAFLGIGEPSKEEIYKEDTVRPFTYSPHVHVMHNSSHSQGLPQSIAQYLNCSAGHYLEGCRCSPVFGQV